MYCSVCIDSESVPMNGIFYRQEFFGFIFATTNLNHTQSQLCVLRKWMEMTKVSYHIVFVTVSFTFASSDAITPNLSASTSFQPNPHSNPPPPPLSFPYSISLQLFSFDTRVSFWKRESISLRWIIHASDSSRSELGLNCALYCAPPFDRRRTIVVENGDRRQKNMVHSTERQTFRMAIYPFSIVKGATAV